MAEMERRSFLKGLAAITGVLVSPSVLYGLTDAKVITPVDLKLDGPTGSVLSGFDVAKSGKDETILSVVERTADKINLAEVYKIELMEDFVAQRPIEVLIRGVEDEVLSGDVHTYIASGELVQIINGDVVAFLGKRDEYLGVQCVRVPKETVTEMVSAGWIGRMA